MNWLVVGIVMAVTFVLSGLAWGLFEVVVRTGDGINGVLVLAVVTMMTVGFLLGLSVGGLVD